MPLDTGDMAVETRLRPRTDGLTALRPAPVLLDEGGPLGAALAAARRSLGLEVEDIALATRVRTSYIQAIETFDFAALPSRPFVIGFVRAYARALGLDSEAVVARFRAEAPHVDGDLQAPVTIDRRAALAPRLAALAAAMIVMAVVGWNLSRHAQISSSRPVAMAPAAPADTTRLQSVTLGAPLPMPPEAAAPPTYQTPGLATDQAGGENQTANAAGASQIANGATFRAGGAIYGAGAPGAGLILQALAPAGLVVRGPGGVIFARQLAAGEAWRAPAGGGLTADVDVPAKVEVFVNSAAQGVLKDAHTSLSSLID